MASRSSSSDFSDFRNSFESFETPTTEQTPHTPHTTMSFQTFQTLVSSSALLQDLLREKKAERLRDNQGLDLNARRATSPSPPLDIVVDKIRQSRRASAAGTRNLSVASQMGVKEMEEYISKNDKQMFDLKLELYQRRCRAEATDKQLARTKEVEAENERLRGENEELRLELKTRDNALKDAVHIICKLEGEAESTRLAAKSRPSTATASVQTSTPPSALLQPPVPTIIAEQVDLAEVSTRTPLKKKASFIIDNSASRSTLHSQGDKDETFSIISLSRLNIPFYKANEEEEEDDDDADTVEDIDLWHSPSLSVLSESSFPSVFGDRNKRVSNAARFRGSGADDDIVFGLFAATPPVLQNKSTRSWLDNNGSPTKRARSPLKLIPTDQKISSIDQVLEAPLQLQPPLATSSTSQEPTPEPTPLTNSQPAPKSQKPPKTSPEEQLINDLVNDRFIPASDLPKPKATQRSRASSTNSQSNIQAVAERPSTANSVPEDLLTAFAPLCRPGQAFRTLTDFAATTTTTTTDNAVHNAMTSTTINNIFIGDEQQHQARSSLRHPLPKRTDSLTSKKSSSRPSTSAKTTGGDNERKKWLGMTLGRSASQRIRKGWGWGLGDR